MNKEIPFYLCHKKVQAFKILNLEIRMEKGRQARHFLVPVKLDLEPVEVTVEWIDKHNPQSGGYYVKYADGYTSYSPAEVFEEGYTKI